MVYLIVIITKTMTTITVSFCNPNPSVRSVDSGGIIVDIQNFAVCHLDVW